MHYVFLIIYFLVKIFTKEYKLTKEKFIKLLIEGIIGVSLAAIVLIPSALFTLGNTRLSSKWSLTKMILLPFIDFIEIIRAFIFPSEVMSIRGILSEYNYKSVELYLPIIGIILAFSYLIKNKKKWESILMIILCIFMLIPILNSSFILFQNTYYARWFFMPILILSLMSIKCLDDKLDIKPGVKATIILSIIFIITLVIYNIEGKIINDLPYFIMTIIFMIVNLIITYIIMKKENKSKLLIISIFIFITIWGNFNVYYYKEKNIKTNNMYFNFLKSDEIIELEPNVRTNSASTCDYNYGYILKNNNIRAFNSNINSSAFEFYKNTDKKRKVKTNIDVKKKKLNDYLGVKYIISCDNEDLTKYGYELYQTNKPYKIYKNNEYKEFGFPINDFITEEEYKNIPRENRINILDTKAVLTNKQINKYKDLIGKKVEYKTNDFNFIKNGFTSKIETTEETLAIYQIPYDSGWTAKINGKNVEIEKVNTGLMGIKLNKGLNEVEFNYYTPGLDIGLIISGISFLTLISYIVINKINKGKIKK